MLRSHYQVILLGKSKRLLNAIRAKVNDKLIELGIDTQSAIRYLDEQTLHEYVDSSPAVVVFWSTPNPGSQIELVLSKMFRSGVGILPLVPKHKGAGERLPFGLKKINAVAAKISEESVEDVSGRVLEILGLLKPARNIFISYKREDSTAAAIQIYEYLDRKGYNVFLDTVSVGGGVNFQKELWHRFADTEVVIMLDTANFHNSTWTTKEVGRAAAMSMGLLQIIWPNHDPASIQTICEKLYLTPNNFKKANFQGYGKVLNVGTVRDIGRMVEALRARSLASRQKRLATGFLDIAAEQGIEVVMQPERYISYKSIKDGKSIAVIPTIGVPEAFLYNKTSNLIRSLKSHRINRSFILYDEKCVRDEWLKHLLWLDKHLPVRTLPLDSIRNNILKI